MKLEVVLVSSHHQHVSSPTTVTYETGFCFNLTVALVELARDGRWKMQKLTSITPDLRCRITSSTTSTPLVADGGLLFVKAVNALQRWTGAFLRQPVAAFRGTGSPLPGQVKLGYETRRWLRENTSHKLNSFPRLCCTEASFVFS